MKRQGYNVATIDGPSRVSGLVTDCGLIGVHRIENRDDWINHGLYSVTHIPTGWRLKVCAAHRHAREIALAVAKLEGLDTKSTEELAKVPGLAELLKGGA